MRKTKKNSLFRFLESSGYQQFPLLSQTELLPIILSETESLSRSSTKNGRSDPDDRGPFFNRNREILTHAHG